MSGSRITAGENNGCVSEGSFSKIGKAEKGGMELDGVAVQDGVGDQRGLKFRGRVLSKWN